MSETNPHKISIAEIPIAIAVAQPKSCNALNKPPKKPGGSIYPGLVGDVLGGD
jgi:hypothetical protein